MRFFIILLAAGALAMPPAIAEAAEAAGSARKAEQTGPLNPGRSAGVRAAQLPRTGIAIVGASAVIAIVAVVASTGGGGGSNGPQSNFQSVPTTTP
jgi:hypothetical protein